MIDDTEDFFDLDDHAELVTLKDGRKIKAIYSNTPVTSTDSYGAITGYAEQLTVQTKDLTTDTAAQGSQVVVRNKNRTISDVQEDGTGISTVLLNAL